MRIKLINKKKKHLHIATLHGISEKIKVIAKEWEHHMSTDAAVYLLFHRHLVLRLLPCSKSPASKIFSSSVCVGHLPSEVAKKDRTLSVQLSEAIEEMRRLIVFMVSLVYFVVICHYMMMMGIHKN
jgi:hypothetical protein